MEDIDLTGDGEASLRVSLATETLRCFGGVGCDVGGITGDEFRDGAPGVEEEEI